MAAELSDREANVLSRSSQAMKVLHIAKFVRVRNDQRWVHGLQLVDQALRNARCDLGLPITVRVGLSHPTRDLERGSDIAKILWLTVKKSGLIFGTGQA